MTLQDLGGGYKKVLLAEFIWIFDFKVLIFGTPIAAGLRPGRNFHDLRRKKKGPFAGWASGLARGLPGTVMNLIRP